MAQTTVGWTLQQQSVIKKMPHRNGHRWRPPPSRAFLFLGDSKSLREADKTQCNLCLALHSLRCYICIAVITHTAYCLVLTTTDCKGVPMCTLSSSGKESTVFQYFKLHTGQCCPMLVLSFLGPRFLINLVLCMYLHVCACDSRCPWKRVGSGPQAQEEGGHPTWAWEPSSSPL